MTATTGVAHLSRVLGDRYSIERELGRGGMATVYLAHDGKHSRRVAIKVLHPELYAPALAERFLAEIKVTARLQHPHILPLFDSGAADGMLLYYVMPFVRGATLRDRLVATPQLPITEAVRIASEVASALDYAHRQGVIHRDIKPENILLQDGGALVADFGIAFSLARSHGARITESGFSVGTPEYMSPEQAAAEREIDGRSDVYAVGAVLYEMLAGNTPHTADSPGQLLVKVLTTNPEPVTVSRADVPRELSAVITRALAREPDDRWPTAGDFMRALRGDAQDTVRPSSRRIRVVVGGAIAAVALAGTAFAATRLWPSDATAPVVSATRQVTSVGNVEHSSISPDGRSIAYAVRRDDSLSVQVQNLSGGNAVTLTTLANAALSGLHWSPDGSRVLVVGAAGDERFAHIIPRLGGATRQLPMTSFGIRTFPFGNWLADGEHVALWDSAGTRRLTTYALQSGDTSSLAMPSASATYGGSWSHHSGRLLLHGGTATSTGAWFIPTSGSATQLAGGDSSGGTLHALAWAPEDRAILGLRGAGTLVWTPLDRSGKGRSGPDQVLASNLAAWSSSVSGRVSPLSVTTDGTKALYTRSVEQANLALVSADGRSTTLTRTTTMKWNGVSSPDGSKVAYIAQSAAKGNDVWLVDRATGAATQLTSDGSVEASPHASCLAWSPDGQRLAFVVRRGGAKRIGISAVISKGAIAVVANTTPDCAAGVSWFPSPRITYGDASGARIRSVDAATGADSIVVEGAAGEFRDPISTSDARRVAFRRESGDPARRGVWIAEAGKPLRVVTRTPASVMGWTADDRAVLLRGPGAREILRATLDGRTSVVVRSERRDAWCSPGGGRAGLTFVCTQFNRSSDAYLLELSQR